MNMFPWLQRKQEQLVHPVLQTLLNCSFLSKLTFELLLMIIIVLIIDFFSSIAKPTF